METSDGDRRRFNPAEMSLCEDATGKGHKVRGMNRKLAMLRFAQPGRSHIAFRSSDIKKGNKV